MSPSASSAASDAPRVVVIGIPGGRRLALFQAALSSLGLPPAPVVSYADLLAGRVSLADAVRQGSLVRIESPGKDFAVERALLALGADAEDEEDPDGRYTRLSVRSVAALGFEKGLIVPSRQWYLGYRALLARIEHELGGHRAMNPPAEIALMFDKRRTVALLAAHGIPVPAALGPIAGYDELIAAMRARGWHRAFVKLAHGSSASGAVAFRLSGGRIGRQQAITTVEMARAGGDLRLYNSRRIRVYEDPREIVALIDALCRHRVHVERWIPKADFAGRTLDLRVVAIAGRARHIAARLSRGPMTNLHLLNDRGDVAALLVRIGPERWEAARSSCERAASLFAGLHAGIDLLFTPSFTRHAILEVNAFGDLLPGILSDGEDTYTAELRAILGGEWETARAGNWPATTGEACLAPTHEARCTSFVPSASTEPPASTVPPASRQLWPNAPLDDVVAPAPSRAPSIQTGRPA